MISATSSDSGLLVRHALARVRFAVWRLAISTHASAKRSAILSLTAVSAKHPLACRWPHHVQAER